MYPQKPSFEMSVLGEKASEKTTIKMTVLKSGPKLSVLGEKASEKTTIKMTVLKIGPKRYSQKLSVKKSVPKS